MCELFKVAARCQEEIFVNPNNLCWLGFASPFSVCSVRLDVQVSNTRADRNCVMCVINTALGDYQKLI